MKKVPNPIDRHVGARVRMRRVLVGFSQEKLGQALDVTFQQVQKYEKGTNRIGASRLQSIAKVLGVPVEYFFEGVPQGEPQPGFQEAAGTAYVSDFLSTSEGVQLNKAFVRIKDPKLRRRIVELVGAIAGDDEDGDFALLAAGALGGAMDGAAADGVAKGGAVTAAGFVPPAFDDEAEDEDDADGETDASSADGAASDVHGADGAETKERKPKLASQPKGGRVDGAAPRGR